MTVITQLIPLPLETKVLLFNLKRKKTIFQREEKRYFTQVIF